MIRPATARDAPGICAVWNPIIAQTTITFTSEEKRPSDIAAVIDARGGAFWIAQQADRITGFASYAPMRAGPGYARTMEVSINLAPEARGKGTGARLMHELIAHAEAARVGSLIGMVSADNEPAQHFHTRMGFDQVGHIARAGWKFERWIDLLVYQRTLSASDH